MSQSMRDPEADFGTPAVRDSESVTVTIDGRQVDVPTGTSVLRAAAEAGVTIPVIASVAVFTDEPSAAVLRGLPGLELDPAVVRRVLDDPDPVAAGIAAAAHEARALLEIPGVAGVNVSGLASARGYAFAAGVKAELAARIREERTS